MATDTASKPRVLVVDDTPVNLRVMRGLLGKLDCEVVTVESGAAALEAVAQGEFALFLLDVQMPEMDGFQLASKLAELPQARDIPIIFVTAAYGDEIRLSGYKAGAVDYVSKPFEPFIMLSKVQIFLELHNSRARLRELLETLNQRNQQLQVEIAERAEAEARARHQAAHDPLTNLPNRLLFMDRLQTGIQRARREGAPLALIYLDLDQFKPVNDHHGHHAGDALLKAVASRLLGALRQTDTVARLGGDEFAVILEAMSDPGEAAEVAAKLEQILHKPFVLRLQDQSEIQVQIGASLGMAVFPQDASDGDHLIGVADARMYQHKNTRKGK